MSKVNGNDGNNKDLMQGLQAYYEALRAKALGKNSETKEVKENVPVGQPTNVEHNELGDKLLESTNFYAGMGLNLGATKKPAAGSLEDLTQVVQNLNASKADRADKKAAFNAVQGNDWSSYLTRAYTYGPLQTPEEGSELQATKDYLLNNVGILDSIVSFA